MWRGTSRHSGLAVESSTTVLASMSILLRQRAPFLYNASVFHHDSRLLSSNMNRLCVQHTIKVSTVAAMRQGARFATYFRQLLRPEVARLTMTPRWVKSSMLTRSF